MSKKIKTIMSEYEENNKLDVLQNKPKITEEIREMGKFKDLAVEENDNVGNVKAKPVYNSIAIGLAKLTSDGNWYTVEIPFNIDTLETGTPEIAKEGDMKAIGWERFQILAGQKIY